MVARRSKTVETEPEYKRSPREAAAVSKLYEAKTEGAPSFKKTKVGDHLVLMPDHPDKVAGLALLMEELGITDLDFLLGILNQLKHAGPTGSELDEASFNSLLSSVKGAKPRDEVETMMACHMAIAHMAIMNTSRRLADAQCIEQFESSERAINRLMRTFATQAEVLKRNRAGAEQSVTVQQVNVSEGGQAIVGNVAQSPRGATPNQAVSPPAALTHSKEAPMEMVPTSKDRVIPVRRKLGE
jgi:hypothetical protein